MRFGIISNRITHLPIQSIVAVTQQVPGVAVTPEWVAHTGLRKPCVIRNWLPAGSTTVACGLPPHAQHAPLPKLSEIDKLTFLLQEGSTARDGPLEREVIHNNLHIMP